MTQPNRRRYGRHPHFHPILLERVAATGGTFALTRDVSLGGVSFSAPEALGESEPVKATFQLDREYLVVEGRVAWERASVDGRYECGVEFTRMDPLHRAMVRRVLVG